ncbi:MAG TPA: hypothetical protein PKN91_11325 [Steroidobacteraceae bacterium]|nr:hypothetical protein [Steroidobacteraceae bacterium]
MTLYELVLWLHVLVMGYWIGSDLVINALTHYTTSASGLSGVERKRLWEFLLEVDQHPRNALIFSVPLGFTLASILGLVPIHGAGLVVVWIVCAVWFWFMWVTHWKRNAPEGRAWARWDWWLRYVLIALAVGSGVLSLATGKPFAAPWLAWKVILFGGVLCAGIGIRYYIRKAYAAWPRIWAEQAEPGDEAFVHKSLWQGTYVLWVLWALLFIIGWLGAAKPG